MPSNARGCAGMASATARPCSLGLLTVLTSPERSREFLTVAEVAAELACSEPTVRRRIRDASLLAVQLGGPGSAVRISRAALERLEAREGNTDGA